MYPTKEEAMATYIPTEEEILRAQWLQIYGDGSDMTYTGTFILPNSKIEMPLLNKFNMAGLNTDYKNNFWGIRPWDGEPVWSKANEETFMAAAKKQPVDLTI